MIVLDTLVCSMETMLRRLVGEDVIVEVDCAAGDACVRVDPGGIEQVLMNLVVNARDAMPRGGRVTIKTSLATVDEARAAAVGLRAGSHAVFSVADTGTGIDAETRLRIFEPYFTTKDVSKGTGLGLSMVRGIVQEAGGTVTVDTEVGRGTTFSVYLPRAVEEVPTHTTAAVAARPASSATVLLVEDDALVRSTARRLLERKGYRVVEADSGESALALASAPDASFDLVLTDVVMPGMSGPELTRRLLERRPTLRVLMMSGYSEDNLVQHGAALEARSLLRKPFTADSLTASVREALE